MNAYWTKAERKSLAAYLDSEMWSPAHQGRPDPRETRRILATVDALEKALRRKVRLHEDHCAMGGTCEATDAADLALLAALEGKP